MNETTDAIRAPVIKFVSAIGAVLTIDFLTDAGKAAGALYAIVVLGEWVWKKIGKPIARHYGWIKPSPIWLPGDDL